MSTPEENGAMSAKALDSVIGRQIKGWSVIGEHADVVSLTLDDGIELRLEVVPGMPQHGGVPYLRAWTVT